MMLQRQAEAAAPARVTARRRRVQGSRFRVWGFTDSRALRPLPHLWLRHANEGEALWQEEHLAAGIRRLLRGRRAEHAAEGALPSPVRLPCSARVWGGDGGEAAPKRGYAVAATQPTGYVPVGWGWGQGMEWGLCAVPYVQAVCECGRECMCVRMHVVTMTGIWGVLGLGWWWAWMGVG